MSVSNYLSNYAFIKTLQIIEKHSKIISKELYAVSRKFNDKQYNIDYCLSFFISMINKELKTELFTDNLQDTNCIKIDYLIYDSSYIYVLYIANAQQQMIYDIDNGKAIVFYQEQIKYINLNNKKRETVATYMDKNKHIYMYLICKSFGRQYIIETDNQLIDLNGADMQPFMRQIIKAKKLPCI